MRRVTRAIASLEAIDFQRKKSFFTQLTGIVGDLREDGEDGSEENIERIKKLLMDDMGIYVKDVALEYMGGPNAYMTLSTLSKHLPILNDFRRGYVEQVSNSSRKSRRNRFGTSSLYGTVDLENSRVTGDFSKFPFTMGLSFEMLLDKRFKAEEIAAIILHEIGHAFTFFEYLSQSVRRSVILANSSEEFFETKDKDKRIQILDLTRKELGIKDDSFETLLELQDTHQDRRAFITIIEAKAMEAIRHETGDTIYGKRSAEQLADQFAARHGATRDLVTGLDRMFKLGGEVQRRSMPVYIGMEVSKVLLLISSGAAATVLPAAIATYALFSALIIIASQFPSDDYDRAKERLTKLRQQLIEKSKIRGLSKDEVQSIVEDADFIEELLNKYNDNKTFVEYFFLAVSAPWRGKKRKVLEMQKELEALSSNELYLSSIKLQNIGYKG